MRTVLPRGQAREDDSGTTLIEVLVSLVVFSILAAALLSLLLSTATMVRTARQRVVAGQVVAAVVDEARAQGAVTVTPGRTTSTRTVGATTFTVVRDAAFVARDAASTECTSPGNPSFLRVHVEVSWTGMGSVRPVAGDTLITPSIGEADRATGSLAVQVVDRDGNPSAGTPVTMSAGTTPGPGTTQLTTADGCAVFAFVPPGTYTASLDEAGWVDPQGQPTPSVSTSVTASQTAVVQLQYDRAGDLTLVPDTDPGHPAPNDLSWTLVNTAFTTADHTRVFPPDGTLPLVVHGLFPAAAGYTGWAGGCPGGDPGDVGRPAPVPVQQGQPAVLTVPVARVEVQARRNGPMPGPWQVTATRVDDPGCTAGEAYTFSSPTGGAIGAALPFGSWTFTVASSVGSATSPTVVLAPGTGSGTGNGTGHGNGNGNGNGTGNGTGNGQNGAGSGSPVTTVAVNLP